MKNFFKYTFASVVGFIIAGLILFILFIGIISSIVSSSQNKEIKIHQHTLLVANFNIPILERGSKNPFENFDFSELSTHTPIGLNDIIKNIKKAKTDENIEGIFLNLSIIPARIGTIEEIRNALLDFKESGKFIISYADYYSQSSYYLASVADEVYLNNEGVINFRGLTAELMFFKGSLKKLGIEPQVLKVGKYKSAIEPLILDKMSDENREQIETFMGSIWEHVVKGISEQRNITVKDLNNLADNLTISNADSALNYNLIDGLRYKDEVLTELKEKAGIEQNRKLKTVSLSNYTKVPNLNRKHRGLAKQKVAVVYAQGDIVTGKDNSQQIIASETTSNALRKAREDSTVKAIVFRINSGGGSALASEIIWREVKLATQVKPVIASFSDVAASGGYYIACAADTIVAHENTITGSIGVFGVLFNGKEFLNSKLGITVDKVTTNKHSDYGTFSRSLDNYEKSVIQKEINGIYDTFLGHVAEGRNMTKEQVNKIGQGRVWSGANAMKIGLIDVYGGMDKAIEIAVERAGLENYRIVELPKQKDLEEILKEFTNDVKVTFVKDELGEAYGYYKNLKNIINNEGVLAKMPYNIEIE